jgi:Dolichyl-phosphate-mannose-protein mannosyltransferase
VLVPGPPTQMLGGVPLGAAGVVALALVVYAGLALAVPREWRVIAGAFAAVVALKVVLALTAPPLGLTAMYWAHATADGTAERPTQVQQQLDLRDEQFGVFFFNDATRFNFGPDVQPGRDQLPFHVRFTGWLLVPADGQRQLVLESVGEAHVELDGAEVIATQQAEGDQTAQGNTGVAAGLHQLQVYYTRPPARVPRLKLSWQAQPGGALEPVGAPALRRAADARSDMTWRVGGLVADAALALLILAWLALGVYEAVNAGAAERIRAALAAVPLVFLAQGLVVFAPIAGTATILSGLDDWLVYESSARDILLNGLPMTGGQDHAAAYYGQPLYPYALAVAHLLTGESLFGPLVLQFAAVGLVVVGTYLLGVRAFGSRNAGLAALALFWALIVLEAEHFKVARQLFNENLYMPLVMASLIAVVGVARLRHAMAAWQALLVGVLLGVTAISRSQFLLFVPFGLLVLVLAWRRVAGTPRALVSAVLVVVGVGLAIAPITWRNWAVSGQFVPISASGGASLLEFHRPPPGLINQGALQNDPLFNALHLDAQTRTVVAFARQDPAGYVATLLPLAAHSLGLQGRNDPGVYWPLFVTVVLYVAGFGLKSVRRLYVWPIHAFVLSHLLVLMLFEADTYGYRLVVPMYAPMAVVAAQLPLVALRRLVAAGGLPQLAPAVVGLLVAVAVSQQAISVISGWNERETAFHGLGGMAAHAARTSDHAAADFIYVASVDGTPRRFGAGNLPGLRYPWFKWFDPSRSLPLPAPAERAVYALGELDGHATNDLIVGCLGAPDATDEVVVDGAGARQRCSIQSDGTAISATFDGVAQVDAVRLPPSAEAGQPLPAELVWHPLAQQSVGQQVSMHLEDPEAGDGTQWGNGTLELYPANQWDPSEALLSRLPIATDPTAIPQTYRVTLGVAPLKQGAPPAMASWHGSRVERVPVGSVSLVPASGEQALPSDMQALEGPGVSAGGLELRALRPLPSEAAAGGQLKLGLLWRAVADAPVAAVSEVRFIRQNGEVAQRTVLPLFGGRLQPAQLKRGNVVRDEESLLVSSRVPSDEPVNLEIGLLDAAGQALSADPVRIGTLRVTGRAHDVQPIPPGAADGSGGEATLGRVMQLVSDKLDPQQSKPGATVKVQLHWRGLAEMDQAYKIFVHVLDPGGTQVVGQRDAEPKDGAAPTSSWLTGEVLDDEYAIQLPPNLPPGEYPIEVGVYDPKSGTRLLLPNGESRVLLHSRLQVR